MLCAALAAYWLLLLLAGAPACRLGIGRAGSSGHYVYDRRNAALQADDADVD